MIAREFKTTGMSEPSERSDHILFRQHPFKWRIVTFKIRVASKREIGIVRRTALEGSSSLVGLTFLGMQSRGYCGTISITPPDTSGCWYLANPEIDNNGDSQTYMVYPP